MGDLKRRKPGIKDFVIAWLGLFGMFAVIGLILLPFAAKQSIKLGNNMDRNIEEGFKKEREMLKEEFEYVGDVSYLITDKTKSSVRNPFSGERSYTYYFVGVADDVVYQLEVPTKQYNRSLIGDEVMFQEGSDGAYLLSMDGEDLVRRNEVKE